MPPHQPDASLRGRCKELAEKACAEDITLTLVRGHYLDWDWGLEAHWWAVRPDGTIVDPTAAQFPSNGNGDYIPFNGWVTCAECGKEVLEKDATIGGNGHYGFCSGECYGRFVGVY